MADPDELWSMRNQFYVGNYEACVAEGELARLDDKPQLVGQRDAFAARSRLAVGDFAEVARVVARDPSSLDLYAVRECAVVLEGKDPNEVAASLGRLKGMVEQDATTNETLRIMAGTAFAHVGDVNEALRALRAGPGAPSLEALHHMCSAYIRMDRPDAAKRTLEMMQQKDEDSTLTQLSSAWVALAAADNETSFRDAVYVFQDLIGKWQPTPLLVGSLAAALMQQNHAADAQRQLDEVAKTNPADTTVAFDRIVVAEHTGRPHAELVEALRRLEPRHALFGELARLDATFEQSAAVFMKQ